MLNIFKRLLRTISKIPEDLSVLSDVRVYHAYMDSVNDISAYNGIIQSKPLPDLLIIEPGVYTFGENNYNMNNEGLYRLLNIGQDNKQRIVFKHDIQALISSICWIVYHGNKDNAKPLKKISKIALSNKVSLICERASQWAVYLLNNAGIQARVVATFTTDTLCYDDGHMMIEVFDESTNNWVLYDITNKSYFTHEGKPMNLLDFSEVIRRHASYDIQTISKATLLDMSNFKFRCGYKIWLFLKYKRNYDFALKAEMILNSEEQVRKWYDRVGHIPLIRKDNYYYFMDYTTKSIVENYSNLYRYLDKEKFMEEFYS